jgi:sugar phosphate isomerase/epimerase
MKLFKTLWGVSECNTPELWELTLKRIRADGFDGIEMCIGQFFPFKADPERFRALLKESGLLVVAQIHTCGYPVPASGVQAHIESFRNLVKESLEWNPVCINSHSGKDSFRADDAITFFEAAVKIEKEFGIPIFHETHRQRILHSPFVYRELMPRLPADLKLTADLSHWCVSLERCMSDENDADFWPEVLADVARRTYHIHARVGWAQSPQVADPESPEHHADVEVHFKWWDAIVESMRQRNIPIYVEPEFGPYPYLQALPYTLVPVVDLWAVNSKFGAKLRTRYQQ